MFNFHNSLKTGSRIFFRCLALFAFSTLIFLFSFGVNNVEAAITGVTARGSSTTGTGNSSSHAGSPDATITVGKVLLVAVTTDNEGTVDGCGGGLHSMVDSVGNTYTKILECTESDGSSDDGNTTSLFYTIVETQITTSDTVTVTFNGSRSDVAMSFTEFSIGAGNDIAVGTIGIGQNSLTATVSGQTSREYLWFGLFGGEGEDTAKTPDSDYTELHDLVSTTAGNAANNVHQQTQYRVATLTGDTLTPSGITGTNHLTLLVPIYELAATLTVSGTCLQNDQSTNCTDTGTIRVAFNGTLQAQTQTTVAGTWSVTGLSKPAGGTVVTVFIDGVASSEDRAVAVTTYSGSGSTLSGVPLIEGRLSIGSNTNGTVTIANLSQYDNSVSGDADIPYDVNGSNQLTVDSNSSWTEEELYIKSGNTLGVYSGSSLITHHIEIVGTFDIDTSITVSGNWVNTGTIFYNTSTVTFTGTNQSITASARHFYNLVIDPASSGTITANDNFTVWQDLTVASGDTFSIGSGVTISMRSPTATLSLSGTISGAGTLRYESDNNFPTTGTISSIFRLVPGTNITLPARTFGGLVEIDNPTINSYTVTMGSGTHNFNGGLSIQESSTGAVTLSGSTNNPTVNVTGSLICASGNDNNLTTGSGTWTVSANIDFTNCNTITTTGSTLVMSGTGTLTSNGKTLNNLTLSGTITLANATHTVAGNLSMAGGTITGGSSTITMTGTSNTITGGGATINNLTIDPSSAGTITLQTSNLTVNGTLNVASGDTLSLSSSRDLTVNGGFTLSGTVSGAGRLIYSVASGTFPSGGTFSASLRVAASNVTLPARTYGGDVESYYAAASTIQTTLGAGTHTYSGNLTVTNVNTGQIALSGTANNPTVNVTGNLSMSSGSGTGIIDTGTGTWTVSGDVDLSGGTFTATSGNTLVMNGSSKTLTSGGNTLQNVTLSGTITLANATHTIAGNLSMAGGTITAGSSTVVMSGTSNTITGGSATLNNLTINPSSAGTITLQTSGLTVGGTLTISSSDTFAINSGITLVLSGTGTPLSVSGTFSPNSASTVQYTGATATIAGTTYGNLTLGGTGTYTLPSADVTVRGNMVITSGANVTKSASNSIIFAAGGSQSLTDSSGNSPDLGIVQISANGTDTTLTLSSVIRVTRMIVDASQTLSGNNNNITLTGVGTGTSRPFYNNGGTLTNVRVTYIGDGDVLVEGGTFYEVDIAPTLGASTRNYTVNGALSPSGHFVINVNGGGSARTLNFTLGGDLTTGQFELSASNSGLVNFSTGSDHAIDTGTFILNSGTTAVANNSTITISGATFINNGTFTANTSTVIMSTATTVTLSGATTFNNFTANASGKTVEFTAGQTFTFNGLLTLADVTVTSSTGSSTFTINHQGTESISNTTVSWSACHGSSTDITALTSNGNTDGGNNGTCWLFAPAGVTISGTTNAGDSITVAVAVNGSLAGQTGTTGSGTWSITGVTVNSGEVIVVFFDNVADSLESTAVAKYDGTGDMTGIVLNTNVLSIGSVDDQSLTVANLDTYDCNSDEDVMYATSATTFDVQGCTNSYSDETLQIESGDTFVLDSDETLTTDNLTITGTFTQTTSGAIVATGNLTSSGTFNGGSGAVSVSDVFTQSGGSFTSTSGNFSIGSLSNSSLTYVDISGGTFTHNSGTITLQAQATGTCCTQYTKTVDVNTTWTVNNLVINVSGYVTKNALGSGDSIIVLGDLTHTQGVLLGGTYELRGDLFVNTPTYGDQSTALIKFNASSGDQTYSYSSGVGTAYIEVDKSSGSVTPDSGITALKVAGFTLTQGTFVAPTGDFTVGKETDSSETIFAVSSGATFTHSSGTIVFTPSQTETCCTAYTKTIDVDTTLTLNNVTITSNTGYNQVIAVAGGDTIVVLGTLDVTADTFNGTWDLRGNFVGTSIASGSATLTFSGANSQTISTNSTLPSGTVTINKTNNGDTVTLASNVTLGGALTITKGTFSQGASYSLQTAGTLTVSTNGTWTNTGTGSITLGGDVSNSGVINLDSGSVGCGDADDIVLTSTNTTPRSWSGAGTFNLYDLVISYMSHASGITTTSSTDSGNNTNWTFALCGTLITVSGTVYTDAGSTVMTTGPTVRVKVNGTGDYSATANGSGVYSVGSVSVASAGDTVTVYLDGATENATTITITADGSSDITGLNLYQDHIIIRHEGGTAITTDDLADWDSDDDTGDIQFTANNSTLEVLSGNTLYIWSGDTFTPSGNVAIDDFVLAGTYNANTNNVNTYVQGDFTLNSSSTFTKGSGSLVFDAGGSQTLTDNNSTKQDLGSVLVVQGSGSGATYVDSGTNVQATPGTTINLFNLDISGTNRYVLVGVAKRGLNDDPDVTDVTVNGASASWVRTEIDGALETEIWEVYDPPTGTNVTVTANLAAAPITSTLIGAVSFSDVDQTIGSEADAGQGATLDSGVTTNITTLSRYAMVVDFVQHRNDITISQGSGQSSALDQSVESNTVQGSSYKEVNVPQSTSMTWENGTNQSWVHAIVSLKPVGSATTLTLGSSVSMTSINIASSQTLNVNGSNTLTLTGSGNPLLIGGTFTPSTGTVQYTSGSSANITSTTYNHLTLGGTGTYVLPDTYATTTGNLVITSGATITKGTGTLVFAGGTTQTVTDNNGTKQDLGKIQISDSAGDVASTLNLGGSVTVAGITIDSGNTLNSNGGNTIIITGGDFTNNGTFSASTGTVIIRPSSPFTPFNVTGSTATSFNNLTIDVPGSIIQFKSSQTTSVFGTLTITGADGNPITIRSDTGGVQWDIDFSGSATVTYAYIIDSGCAGGSSSISPTLTNDGGNNDPCWVFVLHQAGVSIGGGSGGGVQQTGGGAAAGSGGTGGGSGGGEEQGGGGSGGGGGGSP